MLQYLTLIGGGISTFGYITYIRSILRGSTRPNKVTRLFRALAPLIAFAASVANGAGWSAFPVFMIGFGPLVVFLIACFHKKSYRELKKFDYICGIFALLGLLLWRYTKQPGIAVVFAILSDLFAAIPTLIKTRKHPETESFTVYITSFFAMTTSLIVAQTSSFSEIAFPIYLMALDVVVITMISSRKSQNIKPQ